MSYVPDDSQQVTIGLSPPIGVLMNPLFPSVIKWGQVWEGTVEVANFGGSTGYFQLRFTGDTVSDKTWGSHVDTTGRSYFIMKLAPGTGALWPIVGVGPREFQIHADYADWEECGPATAGVGPNLRTVLSGVEVVVGETVGGDIAEGEISDNIICNTGGRSEWFLATDPDGEQPWWIKAGLCRAHFVPPSSAYVARFQSTDSISISIGHDAPYECELRDLSTPRFGVGGGEQWEGSVEAWNIGITTGTFRLAITGDIESTSDTFELGPGEHTPVTFAGTGITPNGFSVILQRMVDSGWVDGYSVGEKVGERMMGFIAFRGRVGSVGSYVPIPTAKVFLDDELKLETSSLRWGPILVAKDKPYDITIEHLGYLRWYGRDPQHWNDSRVYWGLDGNIGP